VAATSPRQFYEDMGIPVLRMATADHRSVEASAEHRHRVVSGMGAVLEELRKRHAAERRQTPLEVLCIGGRWSIDALGAGMAAHALALDGMAVSAAPLAAGAVTAELIASMGSDGAEVFVLSYFSPAPQEHAQYFCRRLKRRWPQAKVVLALWNLDGPELAALPLSQWGADAAVGSINALVTEVAGKLHRAGALGWTEAPFPANEEARVRALAASGLMADAMRGSLDSAARRAADIFDVPLARITLLDAQWQFIHGDSAKAGRAGSGEPEIGLARAASLCGHVVGHGATMVVPDVQRDPRFAGNPELGAQAVRFYAGAPLRDPKGHVLGTLCLLDTEPRTMSLRDTQLLEALAGEVMATARGAEPAAAEPAELPRAAAAPSLPGALAQS